MSTVRIDPDTVEVRLTAGEKLGALHGDLRVPRSAIRRVEVVPDGLAAARGLRAPGLALPGRRKLGRWRSRDGTQFVAVRRGEPALRLSLDGHRFAGMLVSTPDASALADRLDVR